MRERAPLEVWRSRVGAEANTQNKTAHPPVHPGKILREAFMTDYGLTAYAIANSQHVPRDRIENIVREKRGISADTAVRLARLFGTTPQFWMNLQSGYELQRVLDRVALDDIEPISNA